MNHNSSSLTHIPDMIRQGDNSTNIKYQSKTKLESLNNMLLSRQMSTIEAFKIKEDINKDLITKLRNILSDKFNLQTNDFILLIDKYGLKKTNISKNKITEMISYLNMRKKYDDFKKKDDEIKEHNDKLWKPSQNTSMNYPTNISLSELLDDEDINSEDRIHKKEFDLRLDKMIKERSNKENTVQPVKTEEIVNNIPQIDPMECIPNNDCVFTDDDDDNDNFLIEMRKPPIKPLSDAFNYELPDLKIQPINEPMNEPKELPVLNNENNIQDDTVLRNNTREEQTESFNLMVNLLNTNTNPKLECKINYMNTNSINDILNIELVSCLVNKSFYDKNNFKNEPFLLLKILEFKDILYLNDSSVGGFCQIIWEKRGNHYYYNNKDRTFGIYKAKIPMKVDELTIELYTPDGNVLEDIKYSSNDQFNIIFKITTKLNK